MLVLELVLCNKTVLNQIWINHMLSMLIVCFKVYFIVSKDIMIFCHCSKWDKATGNPFEVFSLAHCFMIHNRKILILNHFVSFRVCLQEITTTLNSLHWHWLLWSTLSCSSLRLVYVCFLSITLLSIDYFCSFILLYAYIAVIHSKDSLHFRQNNPVYFLN